MRRKLGLILGMLICASVTPAAMIEDFALQGEIAGENITFELSLNIDELDKGDSITLLEGDVALLGSEMDRGIAVTRVGNAIRITAERFTWGTRKVKLTFAARAMREESWRRCNFKVPLAPVRNASIICDRPDLEVRFPAGLNVQRSDPADGPVTVTANLGLSRAFEVAWKPEVRKLETDLVVSCEANTLATASVGALRLDTVFSYRIIQGRLSAFELSLPDVNILKVLGNDIQDWRVDRSDPADPRLKVTLARPQENRYQLQVVAERAVDRFPCEVDLPVLLPRDVIRTSGFVMVGTDSAIKLQMKQTSGVTQVDPSAFPSVASAATGAARSTPTRSVFSYQYASAPFSILIGADDVVSTYTADSQFVLHLKEGELKYAASIELDVKEAPLREVRLLTDAGPEWTVTRVTGRTVAESDVDQQTSSNGWRVIDVPFKSAVSGAVLVNIQMERSLTDESAPVDLPNLKVEGAKVQRGDIVTAADRGLRLSPIKIEGLREVHTASTSLRVQGAQQAYRFRDPNWSLKLGITRASASIHSEIFHLISLGEGVRYSSATITYHISGAPVPALDIRIPEEIENFEIVGGNIDGWKRKGDICHVQFENRVIGDYTLLATYDSPFTYSGADLAVGRVSTVGTESEVGFIAVASSANLKLKQNGELPATMIPIKRDEIPAAYLGTVTAPVIGSYKYVRGPHEVSLRVEPYPTEHLLDQVADYVTLNTRVSYDGESVTVARYAVKNTSRQFLVVQLPPGATLWSVRRVVENGDPVDLSSQQSEQGILIPISRLRDPNEAITIEVEYADKPRDLNVWQRLREGYRFNAPILVDTPSTFTSWKIRVSDAEAIHGVGGNMTSTFSASSGMQATFALTARTIWRFLNSPSMVRSLFQRDAFSELQCEFTRTAHLEQGQPLSVMVHTSPWWFGRGGSPNWCLASVVIGLVALVLGFIRKRRTWLLALSGTAFVVAASQLAACRPALAIAVLVFLGLVIIALLLSVPILCVWAIVAAARRRKADRMMIFEDELPPPLPKPFEKEDAIEEEEEEPENEEDDVDEEHDSDGDVKAFVDWRLLVLVAAGWLCGTFALASSPQLRQADQQMMQQDAQVYQTAQSANAAPSRRTSWPEFAAHSLAQSGIRIERMTIAVDVPELNRDEEQSAEVVWTLSVEAEDSGRFLLLPPVSVVIDDLTGSKHARLESAAEGYWLVLDRKGEYSLSVSTRERINEQGGRKSVPLSIPQSLYNSVSATISGQDLDVTIDEAVYLKSNEKDGKTLVEAAIQPTTAFVLKWKPRARLTRLEEAVFYGDVNTLARIRAGVVDLRSRVLLQIAQGEIRELRCSIPKGMSVTSVHAESLATWSFDPAKRLLEVVLQKTVTGDFNLDIGLQITTTGLPYAATLGVPRLEGAQRERGALALSASDAIQLRVAAVTGASAMNAEDFSWEQGHGKQSAADTLRRAYRYNTADDVSIEVQAEQVLPDIRAEQSTAFDIADERTVLSSRMVVTIAKVGVFSVRLALPEGFEVDSLSGPDVSHWDEINDGKMVELFFTRRVMGETMLNLVMSKLQRGVRANFAVPRIVLEGARRQTGKMAVTAERGVRLRVASQRGATVNKAADTKGGQPTLLIDILRSNWLVELSAEVQEPVIRPEMLHHVALSEGMLQHAIYLRYQIENAGVKQFRLRSPVPGATLNVTGRGIASVRAVDEEKREWIVELHGKEEREYALNVMYQVPFDPSAGEVSILPLETVGTIAARGYVAVTGSGRVQVITKGEPEGLKIEDARTIPDRFNAGDLSSALLCYRMLRPDYELDLSVVRHSAAGVLPATVDHVELTNVMAGESDLLGRMKVWLKLGDIRFLKMALPGKSDQLWSILVNGAEVMASRDGDLYNIPLEEADGASLTQVEIIYSGAAKVDANRRTLVAPRFVDLPLNKIEWLVYVPFGLDCDDFDGNVKPIRRWQISREFDRASYLSRNKKLRDDSLSNAREFLQTGNTLAVQGRQEEARQVLQQALNWSQGDRPLNEDARVQYRELVQEQTKMGLVNRRVAVRLDNNIFVGDEETINAGYNDGNYSAQFAQQVEMDLDDADNYALDQVAEKIVEQQVAAEAEMSAISVTMPEHGRVLGFSRVLQNERGGKLEVSFTVKPQHESRVLASMLPTAAGFLLLWGVFALTGLVIRRVRS